MASKVFPDELTEKSPGEQFDYVFDFVDDLDGDTIGSGTVRVLDGLGVDVTQKIAPTPGDPPVAHLHILEEAGKLGVPAEGEIVQTLELAEAELAHLPNSSGSIHLDAQVFDELLSTSSGGKVECCQV